MQIWNIKRAGENVFTISNFYGFYLYMLYVTTFYLDSTGEFPKSTNSKTQSEMKYLKKSIYMHMSKIVLFGSKFKKP